MTQAYNLSQLANNLNSTGQLDATDGLVNAVPIANGGTGATTDAAARTALNVPTRTGGDASGTWNIAITNGVYTVGDQTIGGTKTFTNGIRFNDGSIQTSTAITGPKLQLFTTSGTFNVPAGITTLIVSVYAAGGGGGTYPYLGNGGSGGAMVAYLSGLTPGAGITVTVGAGGNGGGNNGGASSFGGFVTCTGGGGGSSVNGTDGTASTSGTRLAMRSGTSNSFQTVAVQAGDPGQHGNSGFCCNYYGGGGGGGGGHSGGAGGAGFGATGSSGGQVYGAGSSGGSSALGPSPGANGGGLNGGLGAAAYGNNGGGGGFVLVQW